MNKTHISLLAKPLRKTYVAPEDLPYPIRKALQELAAQDQERREDFAPDQWRKNCN